LGRRRPNYQGLQTGSEAPDSCELTDAVSDNAFPSTDVTSISSSLLVRKEL